MDAIQSLDNLEAYNETYAGEKLMQDFIRRMTERVRTLYPGSEITFEGLSEDAIGALQHAQQVPTLPAIYISFLRLMGQNQNEFLYGGGSGGPLQIIKDEFRRSIVGSSPTLSPPDDAFVFLTFYSCQYFFFLCTPSNDDPKVWYYQEGSDEFMLVSDHLSTWFLEQANDPLLNPTTQRLSNEDESNLPY